MLYCGIYNIFIIETWLHSAGICNDLLDPRSMYNILRKNRTDSRTVAAFINRRFCSVEVTISDICSDLELLCFDLVCRPSKLRFFNVNRPHK